MHAQSLPQSFYASSQVLHRFLTCSLQKSSCDCGEYTCAELAAIITYQLRFFTDSWHVHYKLVLVIAVNMHAQSLPQSFYASSQVRHRFLTCSLQISSDDCGEYAYAELAAIFTYRLGFFTDSRHVHCQLVLVIAVNMHAQSLPRWRHRKAEFAGIPAGDHVLRLWSCKKLWELSF